MKEKESVSESKKSRKTIGRKRQKQKRIKEKDSLKNIIDEKK
jgi:hypothetical protein